MRCGGDEAADCLLRDGAQRGHGQGWCGGGEDVVDVGDEGAA